ncbi:gliding motility-associated C-terminal domain-containing protein [Flavobacterium hibernum]|uniref:Uncharacterized protein n=1 Tax=Flavobacterium hibernum TaxID=37752 RepID=A0A0D0ETD6_9FLAO|nr:gliding motility-associated C-terminal domain-containing protein [Flavobacterium hibernum]KIO51798.1 hypothetical protein IW18_16205 [Flavobacterium hibernum]
MKKKILFFLLFSILKLHSQTTAGYLSSTIEPWGLPTNINAMNTVYGSDWSQYNYNTVNVTALFDANRKFIWIEGSNSSTSQMITFLTDNATIIENWVNAGGTLLINAATNLSLPPYNVGFGVTSEFIYSLTAVAVDNSDPFFTLSPYQPVTVTNYQGQAIAHNTFSGVGLNNILTSPLGATILAEKKIGSGLVRFSGLTTPWFENTTWGPKVEILNLLYRMISKLTSESGITVINPVTMVCGGESDAVQFTIYDDKTSPNNLIVSTTSSNQTLIPDTNLVLSGTGALRTLDLTSIVGQSGTTTISVKITDEDANTYTQTFTVTVSDTELPVVKTKDITVQLDANGNATITADQIDNGSTDNCGIASKTLDRTNFSFDDLGENTVTLTVKDLTGNTSTKTAIVTIPLKCPTDIIVNNNDLNKCGAIVNYNFENKQTKALILGGYNYDLGSDVKQKLENTREFDVVDLIDISTFTPDLAVLKKYDVILVFTSYGIIGMPSLGDVLAQYIDNGGGVVDAAFENGNQAINGLYNTAAYRVLIPDNNVRKPFSSLGTIDSPNHPIMNNVESFNIGSFGHRSGSTQIAPGSYVVSRYDDNAMLVIARENVGLKHARRVSLNFFPISTTALNQGWDASTNGDVIMANALKWVGRSLIIKRIAGLRSGSLFPVGTTTNTFEVTDKNNVIHTCSFKVTVKDTEVPIVVTKDITVQLDALGKASITESQINDGSTDNCSIDKITLDKTTFDCTNIGVNTVTLTVLDVNGNSDSKTAIVTIEDKIKPIVATKDILVQLDALGKATIAESQINDGSTDNCSIDKITLDKTSFDCSNIGVNTVTLTVLDVNGNSDSKTAIVTVEDKTKPTVATKDILVQLDALGKATITESQINDGSTDNCSIDKITLDKTDFNCSNIGANTVTLTVLDVNGNSDSKTAIVTVEDKIKPIVATKDILVQLDALGKASITESQINDGSTDNCSIDKITLDKTDFDCSNIGVNTVTLTVLDVNGNSDSKTAIVTIEDKTKPIVATKDILVQLDALGKVTITESQINDGSTDNCSIDKITLDKTTFDCSNIGANTVTLTVLDVNGNSDSKTAIVTVEDKTKPIVATKDILVQLDALGKATITESQINDGSTDNCSIDKITLDKTSFDCSNIGTNTVTLTVLDKNGNSASGTAVVIVEDLIAPNVIPKNITVQLDVTGKAEIVPALINNGSTDNCSIDKITLDKTTFDCTNIGANNVTLTVTDVNGNSASKVAVVIIEDKIAPIIVTQDITVELDTTGNLIINESQIDNGSTDNCKIATRVLDKTTFDCTNIGINTITLTVTDSSGNSASKTANLTILPLSIPTFFNTTQSFCVVDNASVGDIEVKETNVKWFSDASSSQPLALNTLLKSQTYYAANFKGSCYSQKVPVTIIVNDAAAPTGNSVQYVCKEKETLITDLVTNEQEILWYDRASGGSPLNGFTVLEDKHKYYAAFVGAECESSQRLEVEVIFRYCDVVVHNGISANGDGVNDFFDIEGADTFKDNKLEIFNSWGSLVFETTSYGKEDNKFKGYANNGLGGGNGLLPFGTYYYVFSFTNHDNSRITKKGFLHLNP